MPEFLVCVAFLATVLLQFGRKSYEYPLNTHLQGIKWQLLGHLDGAGSYNDNFLTLPNGYKELLIYSTATSSNGMTIHVLAGISGWVSGSYYITPTDTAFYRVGLHDNRIWLGVAYKNGGSTVTDATQLDVYCKL